MTSIAANSGNKALADFGGVKKQRVSTAIKRNDPNDDLRSEYSYQSSSHLGTSSNFSSVLKNRVGGIAGVGNTSMGGLVQALHHPDLTTLSHHGGEASLAQSMISYEDSIVNAEFNAITEEERARRRKEEKEAKQREFLERTKKAASQKLQQEMQTK